MTDFKGKSQNTTHKGRDLRDATQRTRRRPSISMSEEIRMIQFLTRQQRVKKIIASRIIQQTV